MGSKKKKQLRGGIIFLVYGGDWWELCNFEATNDRCRLNNPSLCSDKCEMNCITIAQYS